MPNVDPDGNATLRLKLCGDPDCRKVFTICIQLRPRSALLQPNVPGRSPAPTAEGGQQPLSARRAWQGRPPSLPASVSGAANAGARDRSNYPLDHNAGTSPAVQATPMRSLPGGAIRKHRVGNHDRPGRCGGLIGRNGGVSSFFIRADKTDGARESQASSRTAATARSISPGRLYT